ncbi:MAG: Uma2 family endonuclease [Cyanobacteria bacterium J06632_3]
MVQQLVSDSYADYPGLYPDSDGQPIADNTKQFRWIVTIKENLERLFAGENVFVAGDLLWYPVEGSPKIRQAPDVMVAFGRPKGDRGSYQQWLEANIAPQVVFEILSPGNRPGEMLRKLNFYQRYGVDEYYIYDPDSNEINGFQRSNGMLQLVGEMDGWVSPRLKIQFRQLEDTLEIYSPDGEKFLTFLELGEQVSELSEQLSEEKAQRQKEQQRIQALEAKLKKAGLDLE